MVSIIMGSQSDLPIMQQAADFLKSLEIPYELTVVSAHRTPERMFDFAKSAKNRGVKVIIAGAGEVGSHLAKILTRENHDIILLDEPTAFLDIENKIIITKLLKEIAVKENKSVIYSTHDLIQAIKVCDKIWILGQRSFFEGDPQSLIEKGAFDQMFKDPSFKFSDYTAGLL